VCRLGFRHAIVRSRCNPIKAVSARFERSGYSGGDVEKVGGWKSSGAEYRVRVRLVLTLRHS
jgi:hypothetical protein